MFIKNVYGNAVDRKYIDAVEQARKEREDGSLEEWWTCGSFFCTQFDNGYYHFFLPSKNPFHGKGLQEYRINKRGELIEIDGFYKLPTIEDLKKWCTERGITIQ